MNLLTVMDIDGTEFISHTHSWLQWRKITNNFEGVRNGKYLLTRAAFLDRYEDGICPICNGNQIIEDDKRGRMFCLCYVLDYQMTVAQEMKRWRSFAQPYKMSELDNRNDKSLDDAIKGMNDFIEYPIRWILMIGGYGCGKSHMLQAAAHAFGPLAVYLTADDLEKMVYAAMGEGNLNKMLDSLSTVPILLFDDWGTDYGSEFATSKFRQIVNYRYSQWREFPTVMATNFHFDEMKERDPRVASRFMDKSKSNMFVIRASDYRVKGGNR